MNKKVAVTILKHGHYLGREAKFCESLGKPHECLSKNEEETIDIEQHWFLVGQLIFFTEKLGSKLDNVIRALSGFVSSPGTMNQADMGRDIFYLKSVKVKGFLMLNQSHTMLLVLLKRALVIALRLDEVLDDVC